MANENNAGHQHKWRFFRSGGFDQVRLETAEDLRNLESLDQKLWAALACPTQGVEFDEKTLAILDADKDGRISKTEAQADKPFATRFAQLDANKDGYLDRAELAPRNPGAGR